MFKVITTAVILLVGLPVAAKEEPRTVTVSGTGSATATPDRATVQMSIVAREKTLAAAQEVAATVTERVLSLTDQLDIARNRVDTTGSSVRPDYRWNREREEQELRGFIAERQIRINIRDLNKLGDVVEGAVAAGVNQVSPPQLDSSNRRAAYRQALDAAAKDAHANAAQLAESLDARLGDVLQISSNMQASPVNPVMRMATAQTMDGSAAETYNPAGLDFDVEVTAVFEISAR